MKIPDDTPPLVKLTTESAPKFDFSAYPADTLFHDRREGRERRGAGPVVAPGTAPTERRERKERRRRIDPTTFEKQYTDDELEFMNAIQRFKELNGKTFPTHREVIEVALSLGYRKLVTVEEPDVFDEGAGIGPIDQVELG